MKKVFICLTATTLLFALTPAQAQFRATEQTHPFLHKYTKERGHLWGSIVLDAAYKTNADTVNGGRSQGTHFTNLPLNNGQGQISRAMVGYNFEINGRLSTEFLLASEDNSYLIYNKDNTNLTSHSRFNPYIRLANLKISNIFNSSDLTVGQIYTPTFAGTSESLWGYRNVEKTMTETYGSAASDFGVSLSGALPENDNFGYKVMLGNGNASGLMDFNRKTAYGEVYYKLYGQRLIIDLYSDYSKINGNTQWVHTRQMNKVIFAYSVPRLTLGVEAFSTELKGDNIATKAKDNKADTIATKSIGYSIFMKARIIGKKLGIFARYDNFNAGLNNNDAVYVGYQSLNAYYNTKVSREFVTFGLDISPNKHLKIMPNVWYMAYTNNSTIAQATDTKGYDLVYRLTASYTIGK